MIDSTHDKEIKDAVVAVVKEKASGITPEEYKQLMKDAANEWMDKKFALVGKWTVGSLAVLFVAGLLFLTAWLNGWRPH